MWDGLLQALGAIGNVVDTPGSVARGLGSAGVRGLRGLLGDEEQGQLSARDFGRAFAGIGDPSQRVYGSEWTGDPWSGMAVDMVADPLNLLGGAGLLKGAKAAKLAKANNAKRASMLATGGMPEEIAKLTKIVDESGKPLKTYHGTGEVFDKFDVEKLDPNALYGKGIYKTADPEIASEYASARNKAMLNQEMLPEFNKRVDSLVPQFKRQYGSWTAAHPEDVAMLMKDSARRGDPSLAGYLKDFGVESHFDDLMTKPKPNVRMGYVDARNPLNIDDIKTDFDMHGALSQGDNLGYEGNSLLPYDMGGGDDLLPSDYMRYLTDRGHNTQQVLRGAGYDSMMHTGGAITGGKPHQVVIALDPSQVYSPWIAPASQRVPRQSPLLAALLAGNSARTQRY